jgi:hypothetical protein
MCTASGRASLFADMRLLWSQDPTWDCHTILGRVECACEDLCLVGPGHWASSPGRAS